MGFVILNFLFSPKNPDPEKLSAYECGFEAIDDSRMEIFGKLVDINLEVDQFSFSTHADHSRLIQFSKEVNPEEIILFHGNQDELQTKLKIDLEKL